MDTNCELLPFEIFCRNYSLQTHFLQYEGFFRNIRNYIVELRVGNGSKDKISGPVCSEHCSLILKKRRDADTFMASVFQIMLHKYLLPNGKQILI